MSDVDQGRRSDGAISAVFVLGIEAKQGSLTVSDYQVAVQRLGRAVRPWDSVMDVAPHAAGVLCTGLVSEREVDAIATRLADVVRAPMAVGDEIRTVGVCVGSALVRPGEDTAAALDRAKAAMRQMRHARAGLLAPELPAPRDDQVHAAH